MIVGRDPETLESRGVCLPCWLCEQHMCVVVWSLAFGCCGWVIIYAKVTPRLQRVLLLKNLCIDNSIATVTRQAQVGDV